MSTLGVIPARWASTRLPGKMLASLVGKPMIQHVWERVCQAKSLDRVVIATDGENVAEVARGFGAEVIMTPEDCPSGTDRAAFVAEQYPDVDVIANIQGDEPLIEPDVVDAAVKTLVEAEWASVGTMMTPIHSEEDFNSPHNVKVAHTPEGRAIYFSRSPIPSRARVQPEGDEPWGMKHLGLYVFRREALLAFATWPPALLENTEKLEQLRFLVNGHQIAIVATGHDAIGVDTPEDLARVEKILLGAD